MPLFLKGLFIPNSVIEEVPLPADACVPGRVAFPVTNDLRQVLVRREDYQCMEVVGHEKHKSRPPLATLNPRYDAFHQRIGDCGICQLILASGKGIDGDEEGCAFGNPGRNLMTQDFASW
jgi:hypothetical protein